MELILTILIGIIAGIVIGLLIGRIKGNAAMAKAASEMSNEKMQLVAQTQTKDVEIENLRRQLAENEERHNKSMAESEERHSKQLAESEERHDKLMTESENRHKLQLAESEDRHNKLMAESEARHSQQKAESEARHLKEKTELNEQAKATLERERTNAAEMRQESDRQWAAKFETLKQEMQNKAAELLAAKQTALQDANKTQMDVLLRPIKEQFAEFKKSVEESKRLSEVNKTEIKNTFESTMKLFQQEQKQAVTSLKEQTERIGSDAANLTKALKGDNKTQGDWGEMVLESILEGSGLEKDREFFIQENVKDESGHNFRPDVVVRFPEGRSVIIDSKVSLTAYADASQAEDDAQRDLLLREHTKSVRRHVDELAEKDYGNLVTDAIGFVLMFIPNESSYIAAMRLDPSLSQYAYSKKVIIISPSNLLMALQIAFNLWQYDRQSKNIDRIVKTAADLYDKVAGFAETFDDVETQINRLQSTFSKARNQLYSGSGNVMRRVENLKSMGVTPKKKIRQIGDEIDEANNELI